MFSGEDVRYCKYKYDLENVGYVGNDINDKEVMKIVGTTFCPSDSHNEIITITKHKLNSKGGDGVLKEIYDLITTKSCNQNFDYIHPWWLYFNYIFLSCLTCSFENNVSKFI